MIGERFRPRAEGSVLKVYSPTKARPKSFSESITWSIALRLKPQRSSG